MAFAPCMRLGTRGSPEETTDACSKHAVVPRPSHPAESNLCETNNRSRKMNMNRTRAFSAALLVASATPVIAAGSSYDGLWNVTVITRTGDCQPSSRYAFTVRNGSISGSDVTGNVSKDGNVRASLRGAYANGVLNASSGAGRWNGASAGIACAGNWAASRQ